MLLATGDAVFLSLLVLGWIYCHCGGSIVARSILLFFLLLSLTNSLQIT